MNVKLKRSTMMDNSIAELEDNIARISAKLAIKHNLKQFDRIKLGTADGNSKTLTIMLAYKEDEDADSGCLFLTKATYDSIKSTDKEAMAPIDKMLIGCDPELFLINTKNNSIIHAANYFSNGTDKEVGSDGSLLELRPRPSSRSSSVFEELHKLLRRADQKLSTNRKLSTAFRKEEIMLMGSSYFANQAAGFHIHFGLPKELIQPKSIEGRRIAQQIVNILDYYVGVPSIVPEPIRDTNRRLSTMVSYGKPGDWRLEFPTLEYRVPGGFMLSDPVLTKGLLGLAWVVMDDVVTRIKACTEGFSNISRVQEITQTNMLYPNIFKSVYDTFNVMCHPDRNRALNHVDTIFQDVEDMISFDDERKTIINLYNNITSNIKRSHRIQENWGLYESSEMELCARSKQTRVEFGRC